MPAKIIKHGSSYEVKTPNAVHAKGTTLAKAKSQQRLLNAIDHGWKPTGKPMKSNPHAKAMEEITESGKGHNKREEAREK